MTSSLFTQVWLWSIAAFVLGVLVNYVLFVFPLRRRLRVRQEELAALEESIMDERGMPGPDPEAEPEPESVGPLDFFEDAVDEPAGEWNRNRPWARTRFTPAAASADADAHPESAGMMADPSATWVDPQRREFARAANASAMNAGAMNASATNPGMTHPGTRNPGEPPVASSGVSPADGALPADDVADARPAAPAAQEESASGVDRAPAKASGRAAARVPGGVARVPATGGFEAAAPVDASRSDQDWAHGSADDTAAVGSAAADTANTWFQEPSVDDADPVAAGQPATAEPVSRGADSVPHADPAPTDAAPMDAAAPTDAAARTAQTWTGQLSWLAGEDESTAQDEPDVASAGTNHVTEMSTAVAAPADQQADSTSAVDAADSPSSNAPSSNAPSSSAPSPSAPAPSAPAVETPGGDDPTADGSAPSAGSDAAGEDVTARVADADSVQEPVHGENGEENSGDLPRRTPGAAARPGPGGDIVSGQVGPLIKGHASSRQYHTPDSPAYEQIVADVWFRSASDAELAGFHSWDGR